MANPKHIKWLLEGVESWNKRRQTADFAPDFSGADIPYEFDKAGHPPIQVILRNGGIDLTNANFRNVKFANAKLKEVTLRNADLREADLTCTELWETDLTNADLSFAQLNGANLRTAILNGANLTGAKLWKANLFPKESSETSLCLGSSEIPPAKRILTIRGLLNEIRRLKNHHKGTQLFFRGEPSSGLELRPSVMRDGFIESESKMLLDLTSRRPAEFSGTNSALAQWVLAQHHGLNTRFLDVTKNPLVALFFACHHRRNEKAMHKAPGQLHVFAVPPPLVKPFNSDTVSVIANFARLSQYEQGLILGKRRSSNGCDYMVPYSGIRKRYADATLRLYQFIRQEKPYFEERIDPRDFYRVIVVEPQQSLERIRAQSGAFLMSAFHERFEKCEILSKNANIPVYDQYTFTIPRNRKKAIIDDLQLLNITWETLFPGLDASAEAVKNLYRPEQRSKPSSV